MIAGFLPFRKVCFSHEYISDISMNSQIPQTAEKGIFQQLWGRLFEGRLA